MNFRRFLELLLSTYIYVASTSCGAGHAREVDAGEVGAGDAGEVDAGEVDAGEVDAGEVDAGKCDLPYGHGSNACGGCATLEAEPMAPCSDAGGECYWTCASPNALMCSCY